MSSWLTCFMKKIKWGDEINYCTWYRLFLFHDTISSMCFISCSCAAAINLSKSANVTPVWLPFFIFFNLLNVYGLDITLQGRMRKGCFSLREWLPELIFDGFRIHMLGCFLMHSKCDFWCDCKSDIIMANNDISLKKISMPYWKWQGHSNVFPFKNISYNNLLNPNFIWYL